MKMPLSWHLECLNNFKSSLQHEEEELIRMETLLIRSRIRFKVYEQQIADAIKQRKDGFDSDKFGKRKSLT